jgi:transposase, IS5 family
VIKTFYDQPKQICASRSHSVEDRIVSIHQSHVRPSVRRKSQAKVGFGAKILVSIIDGIFFLDDLVLDAFNKGTDIMKYVERYKLRFGCFQGNF